MKRIATTLLILLFAATASAAPRRRAVRPVEPPLFKAIDAIAEEALADGVPGFVVAISIGDRLLFERAYGVQSTSEGTPVETGTIFQVASITKQFTAAAIMKLIERGEIELDQDVRSILPEVDTGAWVVTIEHLLTHTSGLPNYIETSFDLHESVTHQDLFEELEKRSMRFEPGTRWEYNNAGYYLLGIVIERVSGQTYPEFLEAELLHPLGLVESAYCGRPPAWPVPDGYVKLGSVVIAFEAMDMSIPFAAGALCSTGEDLVRWARALEQGRAVSIDSYEAMTEDYRLSNGSLTGYGYGIGVGTWNGVPVLSHSGGIPGFSSFLLVAPESEFAIAVVANLFSTSEGVAANIGRRIAELFD